MEPAISAQQENETKQEEQRPPLRTRGTPRLGLIAAILGFFVGFAAVALIAPVGTKFKGLMGLSAVSLGLLVATPNLTGSLLRIPFGAWADKSGGRKPILVLLGISLVGLAGMSAVILEYYPNRLTSGIYPLLLVFAALCGCGIATFSPGIAQTSYWFPQKKQGSALGAFAGLANTSPGFSTLLLPFALTGVGLGGAYLSWFVFVAIGTVVYFLIARDAYYFQVRKKVSTSEEAARIARMMGEELVPSGSAMKALKVSAKAWRNWALVALYFTSFGGFLALTSWFPTYWSLFHGISIADAAILTALGFTFVACIARTFGGRVGDRLGGENTTLLGFSLLLVGAAILVMFRSFTFDVAGVVVVGTGMGIANAAVFKLVARYVPHAVGGAAGWVGGLGAFGGFVVPPILGQFVDIFGKGGYSLGFIVYAALAACSLVITMVLRSRWLLVDLEHREAKVSH